MQRTAILYNTVQHNTIQDNKIQDATQYNAIRYTKDVSRYSAIQHDATYWNTIQQNAKVSQCDQT